MIDLISREKAIHELRRILFKYEDENEEKYINNKKVDEWFGLVRPSVQDMNDLDVQTLVNLPSESPWNTGTPTEIEEDEYWKWNYVLVLHTEYDCIGDYLAGLLFAPDFERQVFTAPQGYGKELIVPFKDVVAWKKIEPYEEKEE